MNTLPRLSLFEAMTQPTFEAERIKREAKKALEKNVYSVVTDERFARSWGVGYGVRNDTIGVFENDEPYDLMSRAEEYCAELEDLEELRLLRLREEEKAT